MKTTDLITTLKAYRNDFSSSGWAKTLGIEDDEIDELIQRLLQFDDLKRLFFDTLDPLLELTAYLLAISEDNI